MAIRIEIAKDAIKPAFDKQIASLKRSKLTTTNPLMIKIIDEEIATLTKAFDTITEVK